MALTMTLAELRTALKIRAGLNTSGTSVDLTSTVLDEIINDALFEAHDVYTQKNLDYKTAAAVLSVVSGTDTYALPSDFYKVRVVWLLRGERYVRLRSTDLDAAHIYTGRTAGIYRYRITNRNIVLMPEPARSETVRVFYTPIVEELEADGDTYTFDSPIERKYVLALGWRDILDRQNLDPSPAIAKIQQYEAKLRTAADGLDSEPFYLDPRGAYQFDDDMEELP